MERKKKVVFRDDNRTKISIGYVTIDDFFVKVENESGDTILINKANVVTIRDGDY
jgi:hypothetical protein